MAQLRAMFKGYVDTQEVARIEIILENEEIDVTTQTKPDPNWSFTDAGGHYHAWSKNGTYPTLDVVREHLACNDNCEEGFQECDGYYASTRVCHICREEITPGSCASMHTQTIPGRSSWRANVIGADRVQLEQTYSIRITNKNGRTIAFGVAECTRINCCVGDFPEYEFQGIGELGHRP